MNKDQILNIVLVISLFLVIHGMTQTGDPDKKTAQAGADETAIGTVGAVGSFIMKKTVVPWFAWMIVVGAIPFLWNNIKSMFVSSPTIPMWVWIGAGIILLIVVLKKK